MKGNISITISDVLYYGMQTLRYNAFFHQLAQEMTNCTATSVNKTNEIDFGDLEWSPAPFKVDEFLKRFSLPQIVKVNEGYYGDNEDSSLGADQILTLHIVKSIERVMGHDYRGKEVNIPLNCPNKVEIRPSNSKDIYESVEELGTLFPSHVRISQGFYSSERDEEILNVGDKLRLISYDKRKNGTLVCVNQNGTQLELPRDTVAGFQPLADGNEYYLAEVMKRFTLPLYVQFVDPPMTVAGNENRAGYNTSFNSSLGPLYLQNKYIENLVIASAFSADGYRTVVTFPRNLDIRIVACEEMLRNNSKYAKLCKMVNEGVDLASIKQIDCSGAFKPRNSIKEYKFKELVTYDQPKAVPRPQTVPEDEAEVEKPEVETAPDVTKYNESGVNGRNEDVMKELNNEMKGRSNSIDTVLPQKRVPKKPIRKRMSLGELETNKDPEKSVEAKETTCSEEKEEGSRSEKNSVVVKESKAPDLSNYSIKNVSEMLRELGMSKYVVKFEAEMVDGELLSCLTDDILMCDFSMNKLHCMKLRKYLQGWRPKL